MDGTKQEDFPPQEPENNNPEHDGDPWDNYGDVDDIPENVDEIPPAVKFLVGYITRGMEKIAATQTATNTSEMQRLLDNMSSADQLVPQITPDATAPPREEEEFAIAAPGYRSP